jgi:L-asparaginase
VDKLKDLSKAGIPVVVTSQCLYCFSDPSLYEVGRLAMAEGVMSVHDMTRESAVVKLMWVLGQTQS